MKLGPQFYLPKKGILEPNNQDDPFLYYYHPIVGFLFCSRIKQAISLLRPSYDSILDLGYGSGILIPSLASIGNKIFGIDINSNPQRVTQNLEEIGVHASLIKGDICYVNYPDKSFDLVVAISVMEHLREVDLLLGRVFQILRPGGHFLVGMPRVNNFMKLAFSAIGFHNIDAHHVTDYKDFLQKAEKFFKLERVKRMPSWAPWSMSFYFNFLFSRH